MANYYGNPYLAGSGGVGTWANPYKYNDLCSPNIMDDMPAGSELRVIGKVDTELYSNLAGTLTLDPTKTYISTSLDLTGVLSAGDVVYIPSATRLQYYYIKAVTSTQLQLDDNYMAYGSFETLVGTTGKKVLNDMLRSSDTYLFKGIDMGTVGTPNVVTFGWTADGVQGGNTVLFNSISYKQFRMFNDSDNLEVDGRRCILLNRGGAYWGVGSINIKTTYPFKHMSMVGSSFNNYFRKFMVDTIFAGQAINYSYSDDIIDWSDYVFECGKFFCGRYGSIVSPYNNGGQRGGRINIDAIYTGNPTFATKINWMGDSKIGEIHTRYGVILNGYYGTDVKNELELGSLKKLTTALNVNLILSSGFKGRIKRKVGYSDDVLTTFVCEINGAEYLYGTDLSFAPVKTVGYFVNVDTLNYQGSFKRFLFKNCKLNVDLSTAIVAQVEKDSAFNTAQVCLQGCVDGSDVVIPDRECLGTSDWKDFCDMAEVIAETSVYKTSPPSLKFRCTNEAVWYKKVINVRGQAGKTTTVDIWLRKNVSYGSTNLPYVKLSWIDSVGGIQSSIDVMSDVDNIWEKQIVTATPAKDGDLYLEIWVYGASGSALVYVDDINVGVA